MTNPLKTIFYGICVLSKMCSVAFPILPALYSVITILFMVLGIAGIIAFAAGAKFKNLARGIYGMVNFITKFISMLLLFHISYCSIIIPKEMDASKEVPPADPNIREEVPPDDPNIREEVKFKNFEPKIRKLGDKSPQEGGTSNRFIKALKKMFDLINTVIANNSIPFIIIQIISSSLIVMLITFMSVIFSGISKAGYQIHCSESKEVFSVPGLGGFIDFCMHLLLFVSCTYLLLSFFWKLLVDGGLAFVNYCFFSNKKPITTVDEILETPVVNMNTDAVEIIYQINTFMNQLPIMKAALIISLSYYISQLFLRGFEDIISNNIVLLATWTTRETECSDEPNKKTKTDIERGFVLFGNILLFIVLVLISIALVYINIQFSPIIRKAISMGLDTYIPGAAAISVKLSYEKVKKTIVDVSEKLPEAPDIKVIEKEVNKEADKFLDNEGNPKSNAIMSELEKFQQQDAISDIKEMRGNVFTSTKQDDKFTSKTDVKTRGDMLDESPEQSPNSRNKNAAGQQAAPAAAPTAPAPAAAPTAPAPAPAPAPEPAAPAPAPEPSEPSS